MENVVTHGADPTGATDSTADFAAALAVDGAAEVPPGTYLVSGLSLNNKQLYGHARDQVIIEGNGDIFTDVQHGELHRMTVRNKTELGRGKLLSLGSATSVNRTRFVDVEFGKAAYHLYSSFDSVTDWAFIDCRFSDATTMSRYLKSVWSYKERNCYTWYNKKGLKIEGGSSIEISDSIFEYMDEEAVILSANGNPINQIKFAGCHFEGNGNVVAGPDVKLETITAHRIRSVLFNGCAFYVPTGSYHVTASPGGSGNIGKVAFRDCFTNGDLMASSASLTEPPVFDSVEFNTGALPTDALSSDKGILPWLKMPSLTGYQWGQAYHEGTEGGNGHQAAAVTPPGPAKLALITVTGYHYAGSSAVHTGIWQGVWQAGSNRIYELHDVNHSAGANQGFDVTWTGTQIKVANKAAMSNNQSGRVLMQFFG